MLFFLEDAFWVPIFCAQGRYVISFSLLVFAGSAALMR